MPYLPPFTEAPPEDYTRPYNPMGNCDRSVDDYYDYYDEVHIDPSGDHPRGVRYRSGQVKEDKSEGTENKIGYRNLQSPPNYGFHGQQLPPVFPGYRSLHWPTGLFAYQQPPLYPGSVPLVPAAPLYPQVVGCEDGCMLVRWQLPVAAGVHQVTLEIMKTDATWVQFAEIPSTMSGARVCLTTPPRRMRLKAVGPGGVSSPPSVEFLGINCQLAYDPEIPLLNKTNHGNKTHHKTRHLKMTNLKTNHVTKKQKPETPFHSETIHETLSAEVPVPGVANHVTETPVQNTQPEIQNPGKAMWNELKIQMRDSEVLHQDFDHKAEKTEIQHLNRIDNGNQNSLMLSHELEHKTKETEIQHSYGRENSEIHHPMQILYKSAEKSEMHPPNIKDNEIESSKHHVPNKTDSESNKMGNVLNFFKAKLIGEEKNKIVTQSAPNYPESEENTFDVNVPGEPMSLLITRVEGECLHLSWLPPAGPFDGLLLERRGEGGAWTAAGRIRGRHDASKVCMAGIKDTPLRIRAYNVHGKGRPSAPARCAPEANCAVQQPKISSERYDTNPWDAEIGRFDFEDFLKTVRKRTKRDPNHLSRLEDKPYENEAYEDTSQLLVKNNPNFGREVKPSPTPSSGMFYELWRKFFGDDT